MKLAKVLATFLLVLLATCDLCQAASTKRPRAHRLTEVTAEDKAMEAKVCDARTPPEARQRVYMCMVTHFPASVLTAVKDCTKEALPDLDDQEQVARKLCDDKNSKRLVSNCLRAKSFFLIKDLNSKDVESMTTKYRNCVRQAISDVPDSDMITQSTT